MRRRTYLKELKTLAGFTGFSAVATGSAASYDALSRRFREPAVPEKYIKNGNLEQELDNIYRQDFPGFEEDRPNVLVDVLPVGDRQLQDSIAEHVEEEHDRYGINAVVRQRKDSFPENKFIERYGWEDNSILGYGGNPGFVDQEVSDFMQSIAVPVVMSPGKPDSPEGWIFNEGEGFQGNQWLLGSYMESVAFADDDAFQDEYGSDYLEGKLRLVMHELGHVYGLEHSEKNHDLMNPEVRLESDPSFRPEEWRRIRETLES